MLLLFYGSKQCLYGHALFLKKLKTRLKADCFSYKFYGKFIDLDP